MKKRTDRSVARIALALVLAVVAVAAMPIAGCSKDSDGVDSDSDTDSDGDSDTDTDTDTDTDSDADADTDSGAENGSEILGRGLACFPKDGHVYCGWRLLPWDPAEIGFNLYRGLGLDGPFDLVNGSPITDSTNYYDDTALTDQTYYYLVRTVDGDDAEGADSPLSRVTAGATANYHQFVVSGTSISKILVGDLNGDSVLDYVALTPYTVGGECPGAPFFIEGFLSQDGTWESEWVTATDFIPPDDCHYTHTMPVAVWDLNGDAKAEVVARFGVDGSQLVVLDGMAGDVLAETPWPACDGAAARHTMVIARLRDVDDDGVADPFIVIQRGLYVGVQCFVSYRYDSETGELVLTDELSFDDGSTGRGTHGFPAGDIDDDGKDELAPCGTLIDDDMTTVIGMPNMCHNDACFVADIRPDIAGVEIFMGAESCSRDAFVADGAGEKLWNVDAENPPYIDGWENGWCANLTDTYEGLECHIYEVNEDEGILRIHIYTADGEDVASEFVDDVYTTANGNLWPMDWIEGEGLKEIYHFCAPGVIGCSWYYSWPGDVLGDSREEAVTYGGDSGIFEVQTNLDVKSTRYVTPLADRGYRGAISRVGSGYSTNWIPERSNQARDDTIAPPF